MGTSGTILKITLPDLGKLPSAITHEDIKAALAEAAARFGIGFEVEQAKLDAIDATIRAAQTIQAQLSVPAPATTTDDTTPTGKPADRSLEAELARNEAIERWTNRVGVVVLLMFLVTIFSTLYRYNLRMSAFYDARADALLLIGPEEIKHTLGELAQILGPENIDFAKAKSPADHAFDLAREAVKAGARRG